MCSRRPPVVPMAPSPVVESGTAHCSGIGRPGSPLASQRQAVVWVDIGGRTRQTVFVVNAVGSTVRGQISAISNADVLDWFEGNDNFNVAPAPIGAAFASVRDYARLYFADGLGNQVSLTVPAPAAGIFMADQVTVDPAVIVPLINACKLYLLNSAGNLVTTYLGGVRFATTSAG